MKPSDITPVVDLARHKGTGAARTRHPVYVDLLAPCNHACPAGEDVQEWLALAQAGQYRLAWEALVRNNPLPATEGRVCFHPCESACNRGALDSSVSIHAVERFLGDAASQHKWSFPIAPAPSGKRVLIIGAGPSGLAAAYHLTRLGHSVEIHEAAPHPGGMMYFGIPAYRLPRADLLNEIERIRALGVKIITGHRIEDLLAQKVAGGFDAVFIAIGAGVGKHIEVPARDASRVRDAVSFLRDVSSGEAPQLGRRVVIYGGGDTAMDAGRTARRLGAEDALILYRRDRAHMPAHAAEASEAAEEGLTFRWLSSIRTISGSDLTVELMELDAHGKPHPTGRFETLTADSIVLALGEHTDTGFLRHVPDLQFLPDGSLQVDATLMTGHAGVFAGGDLIGRERTVTVAVGHGRRAARHIDAWLRQQTVVSPPERLPVTYDMLHLPVFSDAEPAAPKTLPAAERLGDFREVVAGLTEPQARYEAQRCLSCGNCFECDNCYAACPEGAIIKLGAGRRYRYDYDKCTGCAVCFEQCPCHAIDMRPEAGNG
jgi:formate dehydrogenase (NADP+) beta subunit